MALKIEGVPVVARSGSTHFRIRRLQSETGYWKTIFVEGPDGPTDAFPIETFRPDLLIDARMPPGTYRYTWLSRNEKGQYRPLGNSSPVRLADDAAQPPGASAVAGGVVTPPANGQQAGEGDGAPSGVAPGQVVSLPAVTTNQRPATEGSTAPGGIARTPDSHFGISDIRPRGEASRLEVAETLGMLRGLGWIVQQVTEPIVRGVQEDAAQRMARDREYFQQQMERERLSHVAALERDRQFVAAIQANYAKPDTSALESLRAELRQGLADLRSELDEDEPEGEDDRNPESGDKLREQAERVADNPWTFAGKAVEAMPSIIESVAKVATGATAGNTNPAATVAASSED